jgi:hypothetical protein
MILDLLLPGVSKSEITTVHTIIGASARQPTRLSDVSARHS